MKCPLCEQNECKIQETIQKKDLITLYQKAFNIDISSLIQSNINYYICKHCDFRFFVDENGTMPTGDNAFYNTLNKLPWYYMNEKNEYHFAKDFIQPQHKVLEVGCGKGAFSLFLKTNDYTGLEFSTDAKKIAKENGIHIENLSIQEYSDSHQECFDVVCSFQVLEHVSNPKNFLSSKVKSLKGGGAMIIAIPSEDSFLKDCVNGILNMPPHHVSRFSDTCLKKIAKIFDLDLIEIYHENIQPEHIDLYKSIIWTKKFLSTPLIDKRLVRKFINRAGLIGKKFIHIPPKAYGHTVVAVYQKKRSNARY
ncbi:class I SAM-dependent methyltransferase [Helicobacter sp. 13S00477-4]|uniref:class I SAM-dependent methyltransferase n=1 Tax=Helicobacter sp. 13S00477-4 TaxID=1905759 RepID=UPI000BA74EBF|nr:class I SAM-dependent methyltransferase [Helicobacter sp. 13S00477-4]PAF51939.1 hypothetical protein BKH44_04555 [Helicobacter sp. 13S00477-4]